MLNQFSTEELKSVRIKGTKYDRSMKMTPEMIDEANDRYMRGQSLYYIATIFNVHENTIRRWVDPTYRKETNESRKNSLHSIPDKVKQKEAREIANETKKQILLGNLDYQPPESNNSILDKAKKVLEKYNDLLDKSKIFSGNSINIEGNSENEIEVLIEMIEHMEFFYKRFPKYIYIV